ncbi:hypothetical protein JD276_08100 [Leucobacter sp. CSA1]|uniref:Uncharacterized protein n=1 Tax=Leucobacter chromiisoli TaxID=2796471 RepID=A0A934Q8D2_9MICO|nr:hypothetical protein [Leucobacter chromiisoli]MBK0418996.1 hypothetical protein [Leucobacter chromiisoli]
MSIESDTPVKDRTYDLVSVLESSLRNAWTMEAYIADAEREGDEELAEWFRKIQHNSFKAGEQGKQLLRERLGRSAQG